MLHTVLRGLVAVWACVALASARADAGEDGAPDPARILARMTEALHALDYDGTFVYQHDNRLDTLRIFHAAGTPERERLVTLSGTLREVVRSGGAVTCFQDGVAPLALSAEGGRSLIPLVPLVKPEALGKQYALVAVGTDRVAGNAVDVVDVRPADRYRYGYRLWTARDTGLLLRVALIGSQGGAIEQVMFLSLDTGSAPRAQDLAPTLGTQPASHAADEESPITTPPTWKLTELPPGFELGARTVLAGSPDAHAEHLLISDGVANVSVYVESGPGVGGASTRGALSVYTRRAGDHSITVLGDVPPATVERIGRGIVLPTN